MSVISKLSIGLFADTSDFANKMKKAKKSVSSFAKRSTFSTFSKLGGMFKRLGGAVLGMGKKFAKFAAVGLAAASAAIIFFTKQSFKYLDVVGKLAKQTGVATESIGAYQLAAELAGVSNQEFNKSLQKFSRSLGEAKLGAGTGATAFKKLGLAQDALKGKDADTALKLVADRLKNVKDQSERAAIASEIFGRSGVKLLPLLQQGAAGLEQWNQEAKRLGVSLSAVEIQKIEDANDSMTIFGKSIRGVFNAIAVKLAPVVQRFAATATEIFVNFRQNTLPVIFDFVQKAVMAFRGFLKVALPVFITFVKGIIDFGGLLVNGVISAFKAVGSVLGIFTNSADEAGSTWEMFAERFSTAINFMRTIFNNFGKFVSTISQSIINSITGVILKLINLTKKIPGAEKLQKAVGFDKIENFIKELNEGSDALLDDNINQIGDKFVAFNREQKKAAKDTSNFILGAFDKIIGLKDFDLKIPKVPDFKLDQGQLGKIENAVKPADLSPIAKGSVEAFKLLNKPADQQIKLQKKMIEQNDKQEKELRKIASNVAKAATPGLILNYSGQ